MVLRSGRELLLRGRRMERNWIAHKRLPEAVALLVALMWGLWWIPVRYLNQIGFDGIWGGLAINLGAALLLLFFAVIRRSFQPVSAKALAGAVCIGFGVTAYATALSFTHVANAVLLFYLAPAWSTIIECLFLGRKWRWQSLLAIGSSLLGMFLIFGGAMSSVALKIGDVMALISGIVWSIGVALVFATETRGRITILSFYCMATAVMLGLLVWVVGGTAMGMLPLATDLTSKGPTALIIGAVYFTPLIFLSIWTTTIIAPALVCFLLSFEILSGIGSSALLLDEPFGLIQIGGTVFIVLGAVFEILIPDRARKPWAN